MSTPSLILVPARFKTGKLYTPVATTSGGLVLGASGDFNVTRATTATRVNANGLIESVASGVPRLDYYTSGGTAGCPALLIEPAATNLAKYSDQFTTVTSGWTPAALQTITGNTNATLDPAGGNTADLIVATTGTTNHDIRPSADNLPAFVSGTTYTYSIFAKATSAASGFMQMYFGAIGFSVANAYANFQLTGNGAVVTGIPGAAIQSFGNGWYRCSITATAAASGIPAAPIQPILTSGVTRNGTFAGNGVDGVYLWGAQIETGSAATSYIPTTTGTGSRNADVISVSGAVSGSIGQTEGTIYAEVDLTTKLGGANGDFIAEVLFDTNTKLLIRRQDLSDRFAVFFRVSGTTVFEKELILLTAGIHKFALAYKSGDNNAYIDGSSVLTGAASGGLTNTFTITNAINRVDLGHSSLVANTQFRDRIRAVALYTTRLTNAELATLTTL